MGRITTLSISLSVLFFFLVLNSDHIAEARLPFACDPKDSTTKNLAFCKSNLPIPDRVRDFIGRLTLQEKVKLLVNGASAVPRLGVKGYEWWSEALHGVSDVGPGTKFGGDFRGATSFPQVITTAASFNASLWEEIGRVRSLYKINNACFLGCFAEVLFYYHQAQKFELGLCKCMNCYCNIVKPIHYNNYRDMELIKIVIFVGPTHYQS